MKTFSVSPYFPSDCLPLHLQKKETNGLLLDFESWNDVISPKTAACCVNNITICQLVHVFTPVHYCNIKFDSLLNAQGLSWK